MVAPSVGLVIVTAKRDGGFRRPLPAMAVGELSDHYTCVFSSDGDNRPVSKMVNFDDGDGGVFFELSPPPMGLPLPAADFLSRCYLCKKKLQGIDIFMYRGERAFCSVECRYLQILSDEHKKQDSKALKPPKSSVSSPFSASAAAA